MILHLSCDDQFVRYIDKQFVEGRDSSELVVCDYKTEPYLAKDAPNMTYIWVGSHEFEELKQKLGNYSAIIFHGLFGHWCTILLDAIPSHVKIAWVIWDGEIFSRPELEPTFLKPFTRILWKTKRINAILKNGFNYTQRYFVPKEKFSRIKYCLCDMPQEAEFSGEYLMHNLKWLPYNYYSIKETVRNLSDARAIGKNIFLGNSCTYNNNHIDVIWKLCKLVSKDQKVITPLSYGYLGIRKYVLNVGKLLLGDSFVPLVDYLSLDEYNAKMLSCSVMIQYLGSPGAQGNIITGLWLGMRVYLNKKSIMYEFFKSLGVHVFSVEDDLNKDNKNLFSPLSDSEVMHNREVMEEYFGNVATTDRVENIIKILNKD